MGLRDWWAAHVQRGIRAGGYQPTQKNPPSKKPPTGKSPTLRVRDGA